LFSAFAQYKLRFVFLTCVAERIPIFPFTQRAVGGRRIQQIPLERRGTMKRPIKPFLVEVRKGQKSPKKKGQVADLPLVDLADGQPRGTDALRRAEAALFGAVNTKTDLTASSGRSGRILESIPAEETPVEAERVETKRRGRPPGSRNKPRDIEAAPQEAPAAPKRRGRPPRAPEGSVRKVQLTPELASAALESIAKASVPRAPVPTKATKERRAASSPVSPKREPRPAKADKSQARQARLDAKQAKLLAREENRKARQTRSKPPAAAAPRQRKITQTAPAILPTPASAAPASRPSNPLDTLPRLIRMAVESSKAPSGDLLAGLQRPRAGTRWRRRLRGIAFFAYERRQRKTTAAPR